MPDSSGFGSYTESGVVIACRFNGEDVNFVSQMYLDDDPPIAAGREIWGFPKKYAHPKLEIVKDTLTGTLSYSGQLVAMGTMGYKHESMAGNGVMTAATSRQDAGQPEAHSGRRRQARHLPARRLQSHRYYGERLMDRARPLASRAACQCAGRRSAGAPRRQRASFHRRSDFTLRPCSLRLCRRLKLIECFTEVEHEYMTRDPVPFRHALLSSLSWR